MVLKKVQSDKITFSRYWANVSTFFYINIMVGNSLWTSRYYYNYTGWNSISVIQNIVASCYITSLHIFIFLKTKNGESYIKMSFTNNSFDDQRDSKKDPTCLVNKHRNYFKDLLVLA